MKINLARVCAILSLLTVTFNNKTTSKNENARQKYVLLIDVMLMIFIKAEIN